MTNNITIAKSGSAYSVTIETSQITENYANQIIEIKPAQVVQNQALGPKEVKIVDLLRITHEMLIRGFITPTSTETADTVKANLIKLFKGGDISGGPLSLTYSNHSDSPLSVYMTKLMILDDPVDFKPNDDADEKANYQNIAKYTVQITLIEGVKV